MSKYKVSELEGTLLDAAVAKAEGLPIHPGRDRFFLADSVDTVYADQIAPSRLWEDGGPIIERERISIDFKPTPRTYDQPCHAGPWLAHMFSAGCVRLLEGCYMSDATLGEPDGVHIIRSGATPLIAAMRAYVASKFGEEVEL